MAKQQAGKGTDPAKPKEVKAQTPQPPAVEVPKGKKRCQFCSYIHPLKRGDDSIARLQGTCGITRKIVWMSFCCDKFQYNQP